MEVLTLLSPNGWQTALLLTAKIDKEKVYIWLMSTVRPEVYRDNRFFNHSTVLSS